VTEPNLQQIADAALSVLTDRERRSSAVYLDVRPIPAQSSVRIGRKDVTFPADGYVAFVDPSPTANWGHPCRYLFIEADTQRIHETAAQFPPFLQEVAPTLRLIWKGSDVPDAVLPTHVRLAHEQ
jgi:hypothetical protein